MKIATYNVMSGGFKGYSLEDQMPERLNVIRKAVATIGADFISLVDTFRWQDIFTKSDLKDLFGYRHAFSLNIDKEEEKFPLSITVLTNLEVKDPEVIRIYDRNCIKTDVLIDNHLVHIYALYLAYRDEMTRVKEIKELLSQTENERVIILGDFNSFNPEDVADVKSRLDKIFKLMSVSGFLKEFKNKLSPVIEEMYQAKGIPLLREKGFFEAGEIGQFQPTIPTPIRYKIIPPLFCVDYIFHTPDIGTSDYQVHKGRNFDQTSDHFPISCNLLIK